MRMAAKSGYTIIEVLIVLAISTTLLFAAIAVFKGQQGETQYIQSVQDLNSKVINYANQVSAGTFPDSTNYSCAAGGTSPPTFSAASGNLGGREGCIFLGRAMQANQDSSDITFYTVVGNRINSSDAAATDITQANPTAATLPGGSPQFVLTDTYSLPYGSTVKSANAYDTSASPVLLAGDWYMAGLYVSLDAGVDNSSGTTQMDLYGYDLPKDTTPQTATVKSCLQMQSPCINVQKISRWVVCIQNPDKTKTFGLNIRGTTNGITTELTDGTC